MKQLQQVRSNQQLGQRREIGNRQRVDTGKQLTTADLYQRQFGIVSTLTNKLGIDRTVTGRVETGAETGQRGIIIDIEIFASH